MKNTLLSLIFIVSTQYIAFASEPYTAKIVAITDGDTIKVLTTDKQQVNQTCRD